MPEQQHLLEEQVGIAEEKPSFLEADLEPGSQSQAPGSSTSSELVSQFPEESLFYSGSLLPFCLLMSKGILTAWSARYWLPLHLFSCSTISQGSQMQSRSSLNSVLD